jgi:hypothetical protein
MTIHLFTCMTVFLKVFKPDPAERRAHAIVVWWEIRRILYNLCLLIFAIFSYALLSILPWKGCVKILAGPALVFASILGVILFFVMANVCYTTGWVVQLVTREWQAGWFDVHKSMLFIYGLLFSFFITLIPVAVGILNSIVPEGVCEQLFFLIDLIH